MGKEKDNLGAGILIGIAVAAIFIALMLMGCTTTRYITTERVRTDTLMVAHIVTDSVYVERWDSVTIREKGDTVTIDRWHWRYRWRDRVSHDTIYKSKTDTVTKTVVKQGKPADTGLSWWQRLRIWLGNVMIIALAAAAVWVLLKIQRNTIL
jgi:hypothetical protein